MKRLLPILLALTGLAACRPSAPDMKELADAPACPSDPEAYLDSMLRLDGGRQTHYWSIDEAIDDSLVQTGIRALAAYAEGRLSAYPAKEVRRLIREMGFEQGYLEAHGGETSRLFYYSYLEQAARLCPSPALLADSVAEDGRAAVIYVPDWSGIYPLQSFLLTLVDGGGSCRIRQIGTDDTGTPEIHALRDDEGRTYYLCSNNVNSPLLFTQHLYLRREGGVTEVCALEGIDDALRWDKEGAPYHVTFHRETLTWTCDTPDGDSGTLRLILDGADSRFATE